MGQRDRCKRGDSTFSRRLSRSHVHKWYLSKCYLHQTKLRIFRSFWPCRTWKFFATFLGFKLTKLSFVKNNLFSIFLKRLVTLLWFVRFILKIKVYIFYILSNMEVENETSIFFVRPNYIEDPAKLSSYNRRLKKK